MTITRTFKQEQRGVALAMAIAVITTVIVLGIVATTDRSAAYVAFVHRLQFAIRVDVFVVAWLVAAIGNVARLRFFSELDIAGSSADTQSEKVRVANAILQNTFEQVVLAVFTHLIVAATFSQSTSLIEALAWLFAIGRLFFWVGYKHGATGRAFGFALTFYPNVLALAAAGIATAFTANLPV